METLEQLVKERRGYMYLSSDGISPFKNYKYDLSSKKQMKFTLDKDTSNEWGEGCNLATLQWIADNCMKLDGIIVEYSIPPKANIVVPITTDGKFRTDIIKFKKTYKIEDKFPLLKDLNKRIKDYTPINPITAETMPDVSKIKKILNQVGDKISYHLWKNVRKLVKNQVRDQALDNVGQNIWSNVVRDEVWDNIMYKVCADGCWDNVFDNVSIKVEEQVADQVCICGYYAVKLFMNLDYEHPVFDLIRLGILVVKVGCKYKVFGKNGMFLGEFN